MNRMKRNYIYLSALCLLSALCVGCSHIDQDEQLIYVKPADVSRAVLIEDFTGQNCLNCPNATVAIADLQETYGHDNVVAVGIYSGDFGYMRGDFNRPYPLTTTVGHEYYKHWKLDHQPVGIVNRHGASEYQDWARQALEQMQQKARLQLSARATLDAESRTMTIAVTALGTDGDTDGKLQLWLTEDSIVDGQRMPDGVWNKEYLHNHVFRDAVNGQWGTDFRLAEGETREETFTYTIAEDKAWVPKNMHVVAFVYTGQGVEQVVAVPIGEAAADE